MSKFSDLNKVLVLILGELKKLFSKEFEFSL